MSGEFEGSKQRKLSVSFEQTGVQVSHFRWGILFVFKDRQFREPWQNRFMRCKFCVKFDDSSNFRFMDQNYIFLNANHN